MVTLVWDAPGTRYFETGVDRGVLYSTNNVGIPWNGLTGVTESIEGASSTPLYIDGQKFQIAQVFGDFSATIEAYSAPKEFSAHDGTPFGMNGLGFGLQPKKPFGFSYRTRVGNDDDREDFGYKIHLVYNAYATPAGVSHSTLGNSADPQKLSLDISTIPDRVTGKRPTAHLIIDSRYVDSALLGIMEGYLYGTNGIIPMLPTAQQISDLFAAWTDIGINGPVNYQGVYSDDYDNLPEVAADNDARLIGNELWVRVNGTWVNKGVVPQIT